MSTVNAKAPIDVREVKLMDAFGFLIKNLIHKLIRITDHTDIVLDVSEDVLVTVRSHTSTMRNDAETDQKLTVSNNAQMLAAAELELASIKVPSKKVKAT